jgi:hypothetical protein
MMSKNAVYRKTPKGTEAIATRQYGLGPKLRSMLILIDGTRGLEELARLSGMLENAGQLVEQLLADGFIEQAAVAQPSAQAAAVVSTKALPQLQRFAVRRLTDVLGPMSEQLCMRIESSRNWQEFDAAIAHAEDIVRGIKGSQLAVAITAEIQAHRPA